MKHPFPFRTTITLFLAACPTILRGGSPGPTRKPGDRIWIGPMPFKAGRVLRDDYSNTTSTRSWGPCSAAACGSDHFHIDYGYDGVRAEGWHRRLPHPDYGRILAVERYVQSKGVKAGVIVNAFHYRTVRNPDPAVANKQAHDRTVAFYRGYLAAGGRAEHIVIQTWHPFPDRTGPESDPYTVLGTARDVLAIPLR